MDGLVVPAQRPRLEVEGDGGVGEQVGAGPGRAVVVGRRVAGVEVDEAQVEVDGGLGPDPAAGHLAVAPRVARDVPPVVLGALGDRVEHPPDGPGLGVGGDDEAAGDVVLRVRGTQVQRPVVVGGGARDAVTDVVRIEIRRIGVRVLGLQRHGDDRQHPAVAVRLDELAGAGVGRHEVRPGVGVDRSLGPGRPAGAALAGLVELERPHRLAGRRADGHDARAGVEVHQAVDDERRHLADVHAGRHRDRPQLGQAPDVPRVDLVERRVAAVREVEVVAGPVGLAARGDVGRRRSARGPALRLGPAGARRDESEREHQRHQPLPAVACSHSVTSPVPSGSGPTRTPVTLGAPRGTGQGFHGLAIADRAIRFGALTKVILPRPGGAGRYATDRPSLTGVPVLDRTPTA